MRILAIAEPIKAIYQSQIMRGKYITSCAEASQGGMMSKENEKPAELSISKNP
jgi:hypothetical protein|tara:strand:- start:2729 stop:2887 length:159 start_codon:yes stop_codon:yes gene_type:complete